MTLVGPVYPIRGGIAHYTTMLYQALQEEGHTVLMVSFKRQYPKFLFPGRCDKDPSQDPLIVEGANFWIDSLNPFTWLRTFWRIHRFRPEVMVFQWWTTFWTPVWFVLGILHRMAGGCPLVFICHNVLPHESRCWDPWLARLAFNAANRFIVQSLAEQERLKGLIPKARVEVLPHPVYNQFSDQRIPKEEARVRLGLPLEGQVWLLFGIVRRYKGYLEFLDRLHEIREQCGRVTLLIAGEFWESKERLLRRVKELGLEAQVRIEDRYIPNEEVGIFFSAADAVLVPYTRITGSGVMQLAKGFGVPVITAQALVDRKTSPWGSAGTDKKDRGRSGRESPPGEVPLTTWKDLAGILCRKELG